MARIGRVPGTQHYRNIERYAVECQPEVVGLRVDESLVFTNARGLGDAVMAHVRDHRAFVGQPRRVLMLMAPVNHIDVSGLVALQELHAALGAEGLRLEFSEVKGPVLDKLRATLLKVAASAEFKELISAQAAEVVTNTPDEFRKFITDEIALTGKAVRAAGLKSE